MRSRNRKKPSTRANRAAGKERASIRADLSKLLYTFRTRMGWDQSKVAAYLGCDRTQVSRWERGQVCAVPLVKRLLEIGIKASVPMVLASLAVEAPGDACVVIEGVVEVDPMWKVEPPRTLGRLAAVVSLLRVFEPGALVAPRVVEDVAEKLERAVLFARMWREQGNEEMATMWEGKARELESQ